MTYTLYVGIDIAAQSAAVAWQVPDRGEWQALEIKQQQSDYARLMQQLRRQATPAETLVVMEARGSTGWRWPTPCTARGFRWG